jgi:hypothetical protein
MNKAFFFIHCGNGKQQKLVYKKQKEELYCSLSIVEVPSSCFV